MNPRTPPPLPQRKTPENIYWANLFVLPGLGTWWLGKKKTAFIQMIGSLIGFTVTITGLVLIVAHWGQDETRSYWGPISIPDLMTAIYGVLFFKIFWIWGAITAWKNK